MVVKEGNSNEEEMRLNLDLLQERREAAAIREARYKMKMEHYYNKRVRPMSFKVGEYVYRKNEASRVENLGKLGPKWEGPYLSILEWLIQVANHRRQGSVTYLACNQPKKMLLFGECNNFPVQDNGGGSKHKVIVTPVRRLITPD
ncbi:hypothetical protein Tco_0785442 [Tanacetum coccineum]